MCVLLVLVWLWTTAFFVVVQIQGISFMLEKLKRNQNNQNIGLNAKNGNRRETNIKDFCLFVWWWNLLRLLKKTTRRLVRMCIVIFADEIWFTFIEGCSQVLYMERIKIICISREKNGKQQYGSCDVWCVKI